MSSRQGLGYMVRTLLEKQYALKKEDLGADARLSRKGMVFETEAYEVRDLGHLCILRMNAFLGLMKMETPDPAVYVRCEISFGIRDCLCILDRTQMKAI